MRNDFIEELLSEEEIKRRGKGRKYLEDAIRYTADGAYMHAGLYKGIYAAIAIRHETTPENVERCIRYCIRESGETPKRFIRRISEKTVELRSGLSLLCIDLTECPEDAIVSA